MGRDSRDLKQDDLGPVRLGLSGVTLASERTSETFDATGYSQLTLYVDLTAYSAVTAVLVKIEAQPAGSSNWHRVGFTSTAAGTATLSDGTWSFSNAAAADQLPIIDLPLNYKKMRVKVSGTNGAAGDVVSVYATLSQV